MGFCSIGFDTLFARRQRKCPIRAHLQVVVQRFHRLVIERVFRAFLLLRPQHCLMSVRKAHPSKVGHGIRLDPHDVVQEPESQILHDRPDAINVVIRADNPDRTRLFQHTQTCGEPLAREFIIFLEIAELIPTIVDRIHFGHVGAVEIVLELQVVWGVGKEYIHRILRQRLENFDAIAVQDLVERQWFHCSNYTLARVRCVWELGKGLATHLPRVQVPGESTEMLRKTLSSLWLKRSWLNDDAAHVMLVGVTADSVHVAFVAGIGFFGIRVPGDITAGKALIVKAQQASILGFCT